MKDQPVIIPSDERKDYHHDHNESNVSTLLDMTKKAENLYQGISALKMMFWNKMTPEIQNEVTLIMDNNKPY